MKDKVSVLLTTFNCGEYISVAVKSVLNQTHPDFELIIIDDGSIDDTEDRISRIKDHRVRYEKINHVGRGAALNYGLNLCNYEWIAFQDADDIWDSKKLEYQLSFVNKTSNFVVSNAAYFSKKKLIYLIQLPKVGRELKHIWAVHGHIATSSILVKKHILLISNGFNEKLSYAEDYELFLRIKDKISLEILDKVLVYVRSRNNSLSRSNIVERNKTIYDIQKKYYQDLQTNFQISDPKKVLLLLGWREWFYGDKKKSIKYWKGNPLLVLKPKILLATFLSFLPKKYLILFQNLNLKYRINYMLLSKKVKNKLNLNLREYSDIE